MGVLQSGSSSAHTPDPRAREKIMAFIKQWRCNPDAADRLGKLSPPALESVFNDFAPPQGSGNVDWRGQLISFASSIEKNLAQDPVSAFVARWRLNEDSVSRLRQLSATQLDIVLSQFLPPLDAPDVNGKFISFAKSIMQRAW